MPLRLVEFVEFVEYASSGAQSQPPTYRASIANAAAAPMTPTPVAGASVRTAILPLAVDVL